MKCFWLGHKWGKYKEEVVIQSHLSFGIKLWEGRVLVNKKTCLRCGKVKIVEI